MGCPGKGAVRVARPFQETVHIAVKADLLAVEIACIVEKAAVDDIKRQKEQGRREGTQAHRQPEFILFLSQQLRLPGSTRPLHGFLFSLPKRQKVGLF